MQPLQCLFIVQGEGRGHLTQALALRAMLRRAGHHVCGVLVGRGVDREVPGFFREKIDAPLHYFDSAHFVIDGTNRSIRWLPTLAYNNSRWRQFRESFDLINEQLRQHQPDVIINFYEPLGGLFMARYRPAVPMVAVAHQYMFLHPHYAFPRGFRLQRQATTFFTRMTASRATRRLALSLYDAPALPAEGLSVMPPLLRDELFAQPTGAVEPFFLIYLFHHSFAEAVLRWHQQNLDVSLHCFWNNPEAEDIRVYDKTLTFHRLHDEHFLSMMAQCRGVITTAGFESMAEAMYLGKPLLLIPMNKHFEQHCNGVDGSNAGAGIQAEDFDIDRLIRFLPDYQYDATAFRAWIASAETRFIEEIEQAARHTVRVVNIRETGSGVAA